MKRIITFFTLMSTLFISAQVGINNIDPKATLDITAKAALDGKDGLLIPRITSFSATVNPTIDQQSMLVYLTTDLTNFTILGGTAQDYAKGFYYWDQSVPNWIAIGEGDKDAWLLKGNTGTDGGTTNFLGTKDNQPLVIKLNADADTAADITFLQNGRINTINDFKSVIIGEEAGASLVFRADTDVLVTNNDTNNSSVLIGDHAGAELLSRSGNVAVGSYAMSQANSFGNVAIGENTLRFATGSNNVAVGRSAALNTTSGRGNVALGESALFLNGTGRENIAIGGAAMRNQEGANGNIGIGSSVLFSAFGNSNIAIGNSALQNAGNNGAGVQDRGFLNIALGNSALIDTRSGIQNIGIGRGAGISNVSGSNNIFLGHESALNSNAGNNNVVIGSEAAEAINDGSSNVYIGDRAASNEEDSSNNVMVGNASGRYNGGGNRNVFLGDNAGSAGTFNSGTGVFDATPSGSESNTELSVYIGNQAGINVTDMRSQTLFIENSASGTPLIYGEFDNDIVRIGGQLQIGTNTTGPTTSVYTFPRTVGTAGQVLSLDGTTGDLIWGAGGSASSDSDWFETGTSIAPDAITDNITTNGNVTITNTGDTILQVIGDSDNSGEGDSPEIQLVQDGGDVSSIRLEGVSGTIAPGTQANALVLQTRNGQSSAHIQMVANSKLNTTFKNTGQVQFNDYNTATKYTGTATSILGVDAAGNIIQEPVPATISNVWELDGNTGTDGGATDFLGTTDNQPLAIKLNSTANTATDFRFTDKNQLEFINTQQTVFIGEGAGASYVHPVTKPSFPRNHTFIGYNSGTLLTSGFGNVGVGSGTLAATTTTSWNTAIGTNVLQGNIGAFNTGVGANSLSSAVSGSGNSAFGYNALFTNTTGGANTAIGRDAMFRNEDGIENTAVGQGALVTNVNGSQNTALGRRALAVNLDGDRNVAVGGLAIGNNFVGSFNTAMGYASLNRLTVGVTDLDTPAVTTASYNTSIGYEAGFWDMGERNTFIGHRAGYGQALAVGTVQTLRFGSVFIGNNAGAEEMGDNKLYIENTDTTTPLIGGDFDSNQAYINIDMTAIPASANKTLNVGGGVSANDYFAVTGTYADYVFEDYFTGKSDINSNYKFTTLEDAIAFVKENGHLPNVKSYKEIEANNMEINLGDTSIKNLEKIEENFLYIAELKTENDNLKEENKDLKKRLNTIEAQQTEILKLLKEKK